MLCCGVGVTVAIFAPHVVSWSRSLRCVVSPGAVVAWCGCHGHGLCTTCGVAVTVVAPHVVSQSRLLRCVWCRSHGCCAMCGVTVMVVVPCVVSRSWLLCHMWCHGRSCCATCGVAIAVFTPHGCHGHGRRTVWCCGHGGCRRAMWCRGHRHHVITGPQKRKLVEKRKKKKYKQADAVHAAARGMAMRFHCGW